LATIIHINKVQDQPFLLPFEELVVQLKKEGFVIKPDDYIELLKVVQDFGGENLEQLKYRLAPLIATSEPEQYRFYAVFDKYAKDSSIADRDYFEKLKKKNRKKYFSYLAVGAGILLIALLSYNLWNYKQGTTAPDFQILVNGKTANVALVTDTIIADAQFLFDGKKVDTTRLQFSWDIGNGWESPGSKSIVIHPIATGDIPITLRVQSPDSDTPAIVTHTLRVCKGIIADLVTTSPLNNYNRGTILTLLPVIRGDESVAEGGIWIINGKDTLRNQADQLNYPIDSSGNYSIDFIADPSIACNQAAALQFFAGEYPSDRIQLVDTGQPIEPEQKINASFYLLFLLPVVGTAITWWLHKKSRKRKMAVITDEPRPTTTSLRPPMDIPLYNNELELVAREPEMNILFRGMRKKIEDESQMLNISKSIRSEILAGGVPSLVFTQRMKQQEFLVLIDRTKNLGQQLKLFEYLLNLFAEENINIEKFYYSSFDKFYNREFPEGLSLQRMSELYKSYMLVLLGNGYQVLYPGIPAIEKEIKYHLSDWDMRALITPLPYNDWGAKENVLKKAFVVVPADIQGQVLLIQAFTEKQFDHEKGLQMLSALYDTGSWQLDNARQIKEYLDDDLLYQWLCAIAVYPKLRWEIIIETGKDILHAAAKEDKLNFTNLLKLVRIPWMQDGTIPESTRLELLKNLTIPNELIARQTILRLLQQPDPFADNDHFFKQEKKLQQLTNEFVLYANDREKYAQYEPAFATFKARWNEGRIFDAPLMRYLGKQYGENWETAINNVGGNGVEQLFRYEQPGDRRKRERERGFRVAYAVMGIVALFLAGMFSIGKPLLRNLHIKGVSLLTTDSSAVHLLTFNFLPDTCLSNSPDTSLKGNIVLNNKKYDLAFTNWNQATVDAPFRDLASGKGIIDVNWNNAREAGNEEIPLSSTNNIRLISCTGPVFKQQLQILYNDPIKEDSVRQLVNLLQNQFNVRTAMYPNVPSSGVYFTEKGAMYAPVVQQSIKNIFKIDPIIGASGDTSMNTVYLFFPGIKSSVPDVAKNTKGVSKSPTRRTVTRKDSTTPAVAVDTAYQGNAPADTMVSQQQQQTPTENWELITRINFSSNNSPVDVNKEVLMDIPSVLASNPNARIRITSYYTDDSRQKDAANRLSIITQFLEQNFKIVNDTYRNNVITTVEKQNIGPNSHNPSPITQNHVNIYGLNIPKKIPAPKATY